MTGFCKTNDIFDNKRVLKPNF